MVESWQITSRPNWKLKALDNCPKSTEKKLNNFSKPKPIIHFELERSVERSRF